MLPKPARGTSKKNITSGCSTQYLREDFTLATFYWNIDFTDWRRRVMSQPAPLRSGGPRLWGLSYVTSTYFCIFLPQKLYCLSANLVPFWRPPSFCADIIYESPLCQVDEKIAQAARRPSLLLHFYVLLLPSFLAIYLALNKCGEWKRHCVRICALGLFYTYYITQFFVTLHCPLFVGRKVGSTGRIFYYIHSIVNLIWGRAAGLKN